MKKLIFALILLPTFLHAEVQEISDGHLKNEFLTLVKDIEVEKALGSSKEFNDCRQKNLFDASDSPDKKNEKLTAATDCFKKQIQKSKGDAVVKLADNLQLENYGLIKSKNVLEITNYLTNKMIRSLTGKDPAEQDKKKLLAQMKWSKTKVVDQKVFVDLYTNQLVKNALMEVSRFCLENLRIESGYGSEPNFSSHWNSYPKIADPQDPKNQIPDVAKLNDKGYPSFLSMDPSVDASDKKEVYNVVKKGLSGGAKLDGDVYQKFFSYCQQALPIMCQNFRNKMKGLTRTNTTDTSITNTVVAESQDLSSGGNSCLTVDRLTAIRTAMRNTEKVAKQFDEMSEDKDKFVMSMLTNPEVYKRGKGTGEESLDSITSYSSSDMLDNLDDSKKLADLETKCAKGGQGSDECDNFLVKGDSLDKAIHDVESQMNLKREVEAARVAELQKSKPEELEKYLEENGHFDLLAKLKDTTQTVDIESELRNIYDARKVAAIENLKLKVGSRQISEKDAKDKDLVADKEVKNIQDTKSERARMAQVVMFNNIITSQLALIDSNTKKEVGRNVSGWKKEMAGLEKTDTYDKTLFDGIQDKAKSSGSVEDASVVGGGIIDSILGKK